ncbi:helix-turn-helix domain-containing protein [Saliphagus infecundisoli]|uniref:Helix-turn-helix domain-containing protein n=1 Tax=Saliphagus infecundisoli TaxID=1849069 RepID=A0ABD5QHX3_9EURY|nr:helix-turn-helix domain-containing protein [Saliphagus infecundisoli]
MAREYRTGDRIEGSRLQLDLWHPDCFTLEITERLPGGLLGHGVHAIDGKATCRFTAYGRSVAELETLVEAIRASSRTDSVREVDHQYATGVETPGTETVTTGLVVQYALADSINDALVSRGFIPDEPVRITGGREHWTVVIHEDRATIEARLEEVRTEKDAEIGVESMTTLHGGVTAGMFRTDRLSERQREVFELARRRHYYRWPRAVAAADLADELGIAEATLLEHLRKAESKLLDPDSPEHDR